MNIPVYNLFRNRLKISCTQSCIFDAPDGKSFLHLHTYCTFGILFVADQMPRSFFRCSGLSRWSQMSYTMSKGFQARRTAHEVLHGWRPMERERTYLYSRINHDRFPLPFRWVLFLDLFNFHGEPSIAKTRRLSFRSCWKFHRVTLYPGFTYLYFFFFLSNQFRMTRTKSQVLFSLNVNSGE